MAAREHFKVLQAYTIDAFDLDEKVLKPEFPRWKHGDFIKAMEANNDSYVEVTVEYGISDEYEREVFDEYVATGEDNTGYGLPIILLSEMCGRGLVDAGLYLVHVTW